jgi:hypothetical protein
MRYYGLPELGLIELQYCNIQKHIHSPMRGLITKVSCERVYRSLYGCDDCSKRNRKRVHRYLKKHNLNFSHRILINERYYGSQAIA